MFHCDGNVLLSSLFSLLFNNLALNSLLGGEISVSYSQRCITLSRLSSFLPQEQIEAGNPTENWKVISWKFPSDISRTRIDFPLVSGNFNHMPSFNFRLASSICEHNDDSSLDFTTCFFLWLQLCLLFYATEHPVPSMLAATFEISLTMEVPLWNNTQDKCFCLQET